MNDLDGLVLGIGALVVLAGLAALITSKKEADAAKELYDKIGAATLNSAAELQSAMDETLGSSGITAKMSGLAEFLHALPTVAESRQRTGVPSLMLLLTAALLIVSGAVVVVSDRVQDRSEIEACVKNATQVPAEAPPEVLTSFLATCMDRVRGEAKSDGYPLPGEPEKKN